MHLTLLVLVVATALLFAWTNGMHDASNSVATSLSTGALTPRVALTMAAMTRAARGVSARVDTDVAMAFAASWKPFV